MGHPLERPYNFYNSAIHTVFFPAQKFISVLNSTSCIYQPTCDAYPTVAGKKGK